jgi:hypothetical protein
LSIGVVIVAEKGGRYSDDMTEFRTQVLLVVLRRC